MRTGLPKVTTKNLRYIANTAMQTILRGVPPVVHPEKAANSLFCKAREDESGVLAVPSMRRAFFAALLCAAAQALTAAPEAKETTLSGQKAVVLSNACLRATVVPGTMGTLAGLRWLPGKCELFGPYKYTRETINELLPDKQTVTVRGNRTLFWNGTVLFYQPLGKYEIRREKNAVSLAMTGRFIGGFPVLLTRVLTLKEGSSSIGIAVTVSNFGKEPQEIRLWEHLVADPAGEVPDVSLIAGPGVRRLGRYQDTEKHKGGTLVTDTFRDGNLSRFIVPGADWIAATGGKSLLTVFLRAKAEDLAEDGFFYTWKDAASKMHTAEILLRRISLQPGESRTFELELGVLSGLAVLRRLEGDHGFDFKRSGGTLTWRAAVLQPVPAKKCLVSAGKWQKEFPLPALRPGECAGGKITGVPDLPDDAFAFRVADLKK